MNLLGSLLGMNVYSTANPAGHANSSGAQQAMKGTSPQNAAQYNAYAQQAGQYSQAQMQAMQLGLARHKQQHKYMINGRTMDFKQFLDELCPDADDPMRTFLILKYKE